MSEASPQPQVGASRGGASQNRGRGRRRRNHQNRPAQQPPQVSEAPQSSTPDNTEAGANRGRGNRGPPRGRGRGGRQRGSNQPRPTVHGAATQRAFGGHLTSSNAVEEGSVVGESEVGLNAQATDFVPGQPVAEPSKPKRSRNRKGGNQKAKEKAPRRTETLPKSTAISLSDRIHEDIDNGNHDCIICLEPVEREDPIFSCSKCFTVLHHKCTEVWYTPQLAEAQADEDDAILWRCPGCNSLISDIVEYTCWCGKETNPTTTSKHLPPHSCGQTCGRLRPTCPHPCPLQCHAGPCPPCNVTSPPQPCYCGKHEVQKPCKATDYKGGWSCGEVCDDSLPCGEHFCGEICHPDACGDCTVVVDSRCYCGRVEKSLHCRHRDALLECWDAQKEEFFDGSFCCEQRCEKPFDCGTHNCSRLCHPLEEDADHCPFSPDIVTHCPCEKTLLTDITDQSRTSCEDPIPVCAKPCDKTLKCGHHCQTKCHTGECPPCDQHYDMPCRCGRVVQQSICHQDTPENTDKPWCFKTCNAVLNCGRHKCSERCCTGDKKASARIKAASKKKGITMDYEAEHICGETCGRLLNCGTHNCPALCHRGPCGTCPEAIFEDISCACGRTKLQAPLPCGTKPPACQSHCTRATSCGHPRIEHQCHFDDVGCPPCPYLVRRLCACGKREVRNSPCHLKEAHCGEPCGKLMECGHACPKTCHKPGECSAEERPSKTCDQLCGKPKPFCGHPCRNTCHSSATSCDVTLPCPATVTIVCPCGRRKKDVKCLTSRRNQAPEYPTLDCDDECARLERNKRFADAFNIDPSAVRDEHVPYSDEVLNLFKKNGSWAQEIEHDFRDFAEGKDRISKMFEPMSAPKRQFIHVLAKDYGMFSQSLDFEPKRFVLVRKTERSVGPFSKSLSTCVQIRAKQAAEEAAKPKAAVESESLQPEEPFNALLLTQVSFGLTIDDIHTHLEPIVAAQSFTISHVEFLPGDEVLLRLMATYSASASGLPAILSTLRDRLKPVCLDSKIADDIILAAASSAERVVRRERAARPDPQGWSVVAGRAKKPAAVVKEEDAPVKSGKMTLGRKKIVAKKPEGEKLAELGGDVEC